MIGIVIFIAVITKVSPLRVHFSNCCVRVTGNKKWKSFSLPPALEAKLQSRLDAMRGAMKSGILAKLAAKKVEVEKDKANNMDPVVENT